jgi:hypothetical protein
LEFNYSVVDPKGCYSLRYNSIPTVSLCNVIHKIISKMLARSNLDADNLSDSDPILQPEALSMTIILDDDTPLASDAPVDQVLKRSKLSAPDREDIGWENPEDWEYDNETLVAKIAKLKKKQDGEVENPPSTPAGIDLAKEVAATSQVSKAKHSTVVVSPVSGARSSARGRELGLSRFSRKPSSGRLQSQVRCLYLLLPSF